MSLDKILSSAGLGGLSVPSEAELRKSYIVCSASGGGDVLVRGSGSPGSQALLSVLAAETIATNLASTSGVSMEETLMFLSDELRRLARNEEEE